MRNQNGILPKKRAFIRLSAFALAAVAALSVFLIKSSRARAHYEQEIVTVRLRSLSELCEYTAPLSDELRKLSCAATQSAALQHASQIMYSAACAKVCLSDFPQDRNSLSPVFKFYTDAALLAEKTLDSFKLSGAADDESRRGLEELADCAQKLSLRLEDIAGACLAGELSLCDVQYAISSDSPAAYTESMELVGKTLAAAALQTDTPDASPAQTVAPLVSSLPGVTREEARRAAADILGVQSVLMRDCPGDSGPLPLYAFSYRDAFVSLSRNGGKICCIFTPYEAADCFLTADDAAGRALSYLESLGYGGMLAVYSSTQKNICTVNFVYAQQDVLCYPDLIRVQVALDSGEVTGLDASMYLTNHRERTRPENTLEPAQAAALLPAGIELLESSEAFIKSGGKEIFCHELLCYDGQCEYLIYLNALTAEHEMTLMPQNAREMCLQSGE